MGDLSEQAARAIFGKAILDNRCAELLDCLFEGGSATIDTQGRLIMISADMLAQMVGDTDDEVQE